MFVYFTLLQELIIYIVYFDCYSTSNFLDLSINLQTARK